MTSFLSQDDVETKPYRMSEILKRMKKVVSRYSIVNGDGDGDNQKGER